ncbi:MAG: hypothetical protein ACM3VT_20910, partial [Solirubrobacterales bacterium]
MKARTMVNHDYSRKAATIGVLLLGFAMVLCGRCGATEFFVSPQGDDAQAGTKDRPFKTLEAARDAARKADHSQEITIWLKGGAYERQQPLQLTAKDSGRPGKLVTYRACPGEEVRIVGGRQITAWQFVADEAVLKRLAPEARDKIVCADLKAAGVVDYGQVKGGGLELFFDDKPMTLARWPNEGFVNIVGLVEPDTVN